MLQNRLETKEKRVKARKEERAQLKAERSEEKKRKNKKRLQQENVKDVSDLPEVPQNNDIPIYGHSDQEDKSNSAPKTRKSVFLIMRLIVVKSLQTHKILNRVTTKVMFQVLMKTMTMIVVTLKDQSLKLEK